MSQFTIVLDTNILISSLSENDPSPNKEILNRWENEEFEVLHSYDLLDEYIEKLRAFDVPEEKIFSFLTFIRNHSERIYIRFFHIEKYPQDPKDTPILLCALNGKATHLISYDKHLLELDGTYDVKICEPIPFLQELRKS